MMTLLLFDIDGTLVLTGGAGLRGMTRAFEQVFHVPDALDGVPVAGRTDPAILREAITRAGIVPSDGEAARFYEAYLPILAEEMQQSGHLSQGDRFKGPLPGVPALIDRLAVRDDVFLALLTGNYTRAAEIKLGYFGLWSPFRCGAFGDDASLRHELVPIAVARARVAGCPAVEPADVMIIGDTPLDVDCARRAGVRSLAVATGGYSTDTLREAGADHVVETLEDTEVVLRLLVGPRADL